MPEQGVTTGQLLLAEYRTVKDEQKSRIGFRDDLLCVTLAAVVAAAAQAKQPAMLLALPPRHRRPRLDLPRQRREDLRDRQVRP